MKANSQALDKKSNAWCAPVGVVAAAAALLIAAAAAPSPAAAHNHKGGYYGGGYSGYTASQSAYDAKPTHKGWAENKTESAELSDEELRNFGGVPIQGRKPSLLTRKRHLGGDN